MKISKHSLAAAAVFAGLVGGTAARAAQPLTTSSPLSTGVLADDNGKTQVEKHACKGLNSCKNECKGKGACATDGSKK